MDENTIALFSSKKSDEWGTPQFLFDKLNAEFNFNLDVAASHDNHKCYFYFRKEDNALNQLWCVGEQNGRVFCNPPYSLVKQFLKKGSEEIVKGNSDIIVFLTFANTDTKWFWDYVYDEKTNHLRKGIELRFIKGRLHFTGYQKTNSAMRPSILIIMRRE